MEDDIKEFSERMLERTRKRQDLISSVKPNEPPVICPPLHPEILVPSAQSEVSEVSTPSDLSTLSDLSTPSEPSTLSEKLDLKPLSTQLLTPAQTQPSVSNLAKYQLPSNTNYRDYQKSRLAELTQRVDMWLAEEPNYTPEPASEMQSVSKSEAVSETTTSKEESTTPSNYTSSSHASDMPSVSKSEAVFEPTTFYEENTTPLHQVYDHGDTIYVLKAGGYPNLGLLKLDVRNKCPRYACYNAGGIMYVLEEGAIPEVASLDEDEVIKLLIAKKIIGNTNFKKPSKKCNIPLIPDPSTSEEYTPRTYTRRRMYPGVTAKTPSVRFNDVPFCYPSTSKECKQIDTTQLYPRKKLAPSISVNRPAYKYDPPFCYPSTSKDCNTTMITGANKGSNQLRTQYFSAPSTSKQADYYAPRPRNKLPLRFPNLKLGIGQRRYDSSDDEYDDEYPRPGPPVSELVMKFQSKIEPVKTTNKTTTTHTSSSTTSSISNTSTTTTSVKLTMTKTSPIVVNSPAITSSTAVKNKSPAATDNANASAITSTTTIANKSSDTTANTNSVSVTSTTTITNNENGTDTMNSPSSSSLPKRSIRHSSEPRCFGSTSPTNIDMWTPPCIKNVLLKNQLVDDLNDEQRQVGNGTTDKKVVTSSPLFTSVGSPADRIAMAEGHVKIIPPSQTSGLYPSIEVENNTSETISTSSENQLSSFKRRNDGSSALDTSAKSIESVSDDYLLDENIVVKRPRGEPKVKDTDMEVDEPEVLETDSSVVVTPGTSSLLSDHDRTLSQSSNSFTFYQPPNETSNKPRQNDTDLKRMSCYDFVESEDSQDSDEFGETRPSLLHTISTYRKQQQRRLASSKMTSERSSLRNEVGISQLPPVKDDDEDEVQALEIAAERIRILESTVQEQDRIMNQATQALNISEIYRQKTSQSSRSSEFSTEHLHAERLLLIANLKRKDAVMESQRLRLEHTICPGVDGLFLKPQNEGKKLVIESLRVPILSSITGVMNSAKSKADCASGNLTKWPLEYRYFVCVVRASSTVYRPPMATATRPVDAVNESIYRFTLDDPLRPYNEIGYGYVEFINRKNIVSSAGRKCPDAEGAPIIITGLDDSGWKITVELYGLYPIIPGESVRNASGSGSSKDHQEKSVLDKLWSSVTPNKESKKPATVPSIESPGGSSAVRNTMFRQLGYFVFSSGQVNRSQFTLNKIYQSMGSTRTSKTSTEDVVRVCMQMLEPGQQYVSKQNPEDGHILSTSVHEEMLVIKPLILPSDCKLEGFLTLFDDFALRPTVVLKPNETPKWQHFLINNVETYKALWTRYWFRVEIVDDPNQELTVQTILQKLNTEGGTPKIRQQTVVLRYWLYPEHAEKEEEPVGTIDLSGCLPLTEGIIMGKPYRYDVVPAAQAISDVCTRPNTLRVMFTCSAEVDSTTDDQSSGGNDPLLLGADTPDELTEWCTTINTAVHAIITHQEQFKLLEKVPPTQKKCGTTKTTEEKFGLKKKFCT